MADGLAAVQRPGEVDRDARGHHRAQGDDVLQRPALRIGVHLAQPAQAQLRAAQHLRGGAGITGLHAAEAGQAGGEACHRSRHVVVGLGAQRGIGERPGEADGAVDTAGVHRLDQLLGGRHRRRRPGVAGAEPGVDLRDLGKVGPNAVGQDVDVGVHHRRARHCRGRTS